MVAKEEHPGQDDLQSETGPNGEGRVAVQHQPGAYARHVAICYRIEDGRITERWAMRDDLTMLRQLGGLPTA